jgi:hypothetical protein
MVSEHATRWAPAAQSLLFGSFFRGQRCRIARRLIGGANLQTRPDSKQYKH